MIFAVPQRGVPVGGIPALRAKLSVQNQFPFEMFEVGRLYVDIDKAEIMLGSICITERIETVVGISLNSCSFIEINDEALPI